MGIEKDTDIYSKIEGSVQRTKKKKNIYVISFRGIRIITILSGTAITILTGLQGVGKPQHVNNAVLVISALVTAFAAFEGLFDLKNKALRYDLLLFDLRKLRDEIEFDVEKDAAALVSNREKYQKKYHDILESKKDIIEDSYQKDPPPDKSSASNKS